MYEKFVLLNAGVGEKTRSYGPRCLFRLANGETVLERQIRLIKANFKKPKIYLSLGFEGWKILKKINRDDIFDHCANNEYETTNHAYSLGAALDHFKINNCFVLFGDVVTSEKHFISPTRKATLYTSNSCQDSGRVGVNSNDGVATHMMWGISPAWGEICYLDKDITADIRSRYKDPWMRRAFLLEYINSAISRGKQIEVESLGSDMVDIDRLQDINIANEKFNIGKN